MANEFFSSLLPIYHLKDVFLISELFLSCSVLQLTFYVISVSYTRKSGFVVLSQQIYHIGFLILFLCCMLIMNEDVLFQTFLSTNDYLSFFSKMVVCVSSLLFIFVIKTSSNDGLVKHNFEYVVLILLGVLGSLLLCSSNDLLTAYLAMELQSVCFYLMAAFKKNSNYSIESGLKYFIVGSFASALFLLGSSFLYGSMGSLHFADFNLFMSIIYTIFLEPDFSFLEPDFSFFDQISLFGMTQMEEYCCDVYSYSELFLQSYIDRFTFFCVYSPNSPIGMLLFFSNLVPLDFPEWFILENCKYMEEDSIDFYLGLLYKVISHAWLNGETHLMQVDKNFYPTSIIAADAGALIYYFVPDLSANFSYLYSKIFYSPSIKSLLYLFDTASFDGGSLKSHILGESVHLFNEMSLYDGDEFEPMTSMSLHFIYIGFMLVCLSLLIKLAVAPFHYWSLDVYEGSPNQSTVFFAVIPKIGLFVLLIRICYSGFYEFLLDWQPYFLMLSVISIFVGSLGGLEQRKLKSLLAYSSVSHTGYLLLSFSSNSMEGVQMMIYYIVIFMLSGLCFWSIYMFLRQKLKKNYYNKQNKELGDLVLLRESNPMLALALVVTLFSIAGIPPLVGFLAKLGVFFAVLSSSSYLIALISILLSVISTFYYIRLIKIVYFENVLVGKLYYSISTNKAILVSVLFLLLILLCVYPSLLYFVSHKSVLLM